MAYLTGFGRFLFSVAIAAFGIQHFIYARSAAGLGPPWTPVASWCAYLMGAVLLVAALSLATQFKAEFAGVLLALVVMLRFVVVYVPRLAANIHDPGPWTSGFEILAMGGAALVLAGAARSHGSGWSAPLGRTTSLGRFLFASLMLVVAAQHFIYAQFISTLIPAWIPARLFFAYFVGATFIAAALSIITGIMAPLGAGLLGTMFLIFVLIVHAPRVAGALHNGNEWTSALVALAMSGGAFAIAGAFAGID